MLMFLRFVTLSVLLSVSAPAAAQFRLEHIGGIVQLSDPRIAPDGRSVLVRVSRANFDDNRYEVKSRFVCKSGGSSSPSARLLGRPPVSGGVRGRGNAGRPRRVWS